MRNPTIATIVLLLATLGPAIGDADTLNLDPDQTSIAFTLGATLHSVHGTARLDHGEIVFDPATGGASGEIVVDAQSTDTASKGRDEKMHEDVLLSQSHPTIVFRPETFTGAIPTDGTATIEVSGELILLGESHPVTWPVTLRRRADVLDIELEFTVPYVAWGLKDPSKFVLRVDKEVGIQVTSVGTLQETDQENVTDAAE